MGDSNALLQTAALANSLNSATGASGRLVSAVSLVRSSDTSAAASLGQMAVSTSNSAQLRLAAARSLCAVHTAAALPYLGALLTDQSLQLQVVGAQGMSFFANGVGIPTIQTMPTLSHLNQRQPNATGRSVILLFPMSSDANVTNVTVHNTCRMSNFGGTPTVAVRYCADCVRDNRAETSH
jgi:hypothetical protein